MASPNERIIFGAFVPQGWKNELASIDGAEDKWQRTVEVAELIEELGYDSLWVYDHFHNVPRPSHEAVFECWTTIAALSQATSRIRLGQMVGCNSYRSPALLAKITSTVDVISGGRLDWGIGAGWYEHEYKGYGFEFPAPKVRIGMLRETVEIVRSMWSEPDTTYHGRYYDLDGAQCDPKPLQQPHPPIWIGGGGEQLTLRVVARHADVANFGGKPREWQHKAEVLQQHCKDVGRDYDEIRKTISGEVLIRETEAELEEIGSLSLWREPFESWREGNLVGTPEQVCEKLQTYIDLGCTGFVPWCSDYPSTQTLQLFAERVIPQFR
ncbi:MAG TPA: LLM class F420-dependent oxidoreductase [Acidimicrobiales bacterium]|nr:LLM class F420-dependent oxidoreductase [Acidimicrobiales bacterium]